MTKNEDVSWIPKPVRCSLKEYSTAELVAELSKRAGVEKGSRPAQAGGNGMIDEKICPFISRCEIQPDGDHLLATTYCQKERCMAWESHHPVDEYDTFEGGICRLIL